MFGIMTAAVSELKHYQYEQAALRNLQRSMSPEDFAKVMKLRRKQRKAEAKYQQKLAIAREGRSLNFWGNR